MTEISKTYNNTLIGLLDKNKITRTEGDFCYGYGSGSEK
jgi:hypothetical protein